MTGLFDPDSAPGGAALRITCLGGGPAGLYAAILLRSAHPDWPVTVWERTTVEDTFGFGVVFSAATLAELEAADAPTHEALVAGCARWDPVEVRHLGQRVRAGGNRFAAISRHRLLGLLQDRAREVGVDLRVGAEVTDVDALRAGCDLLLAADGVRSAVRTRYADAFGPRLRQEGSTYIWLATTRRFDAFTFIFEDTPHGAFQAHVYPYADDRSTFIVECTHQTRDRAGLAEGEHRDLGPGDSDERTIAFLQELFADHLDGQPLIGNRSRWLDWWTVRTARWRHRNVVLLGDAAHTAHFSIGSGTKLAMEDAVALAGALEREADTDAALAAYEAERRPTVDAVQQAAADSLDWFARYRRWWGLPAPQFTYSLLTRSRRVDYANLRRRDPTLVDALDRWFAARSHGRDRVDAWQTPVPPALTPVRVGPATLPTRLVHLVPADEDAEAGGPSPALAAALTRAAGAGPAMLLVDRIAVTPEGRVTPGDAGLDDDDHVPAWARALDGARRAGDAVIAARLVHAGPRGACAPRRHGVDLPLPPDRRWPLLAASARPYGPGSPVPRAASAAEIACVAEAHAAAARRALAAGFDALELHLGHGYLLASFLSPLTNSRDDGFGGDIDGRLRAPLAVVDAVRAVWPDDRLLSVCLSASDLQPGGLTPQDAVAAAAACRDHGADMVHVVSGQTTPAARPGFERGHNAPWSDLIRNEAGVPTLTSGHLPSLADVNHVLLGGRADLCVLGLPLPDAPPWAAHADPRST